MLASFFCLSAVAGLCDMFLLAKACEAWGSKYAVQYSTVQQYSSEEHCTERVQFQAIFASGFLLERTENGSIWENEKIRSCYGGGACFYAIRYHGTTVVFGLVAQGEEL